MTKRSRTARFTLRLAPGERRGLSELAMVAGEPRAAVLRRLIREACRRLRLEDSAASADHPPALPSAKHLQVAGYRVTIRYVPPGPEAKLGASALKTVLLRSLTKVKR